MSLRRSVPLRLLPPLCLLLVLSLDFAALPVPCVTAQTAPAGRVRQSFAQLDSRTQSLATDCQNAAKVFDEAKGEQRTGVGWNLLEQAKKLTTAAPDFFLGWVWLARASLALNLEISARNAGTNLLALGVTQNHNLQVLQTMSDLEKKGWLPAGTGLPPSGLAANKSGGPPTAAARSEWAKPSGAYFSPEDSLEFETLLMLVDNLDKATTQEATVAAGEKFMERSKKFLDKHPDEFAIWLLRARVCLVYDLEDEGRLAATNLKRLGGIAKDDTFIREQMVALNARGWFQPRPVTYQGTIGRAGGKATAVACAVEVDPDRTSGKITYGSVVGDTVVKFSGTLTANTLRAETGAVVSKPARAKWEPETFLLKFSSSDTSISYECIAPASGYTGQLYKK